MQASLSAITTILTFSTAVVTAVNLGPEVNKIVPFYPVAIGLTTLIAILVMVTGGDLASRYGSNHPESLALWTASSVELAIRISKPLTWPLERVGPAWMQFTGSSPMAAEDITTNGELRWLIQEGEKRGEIEDDEAAMIHGVFDLGSRPVRAVMTARPDVIMVASGTATWEALDLAIRHGFSRLPVYQDTVDTVLGVVSVREMAVALRTEVNGNTPVEDLIWDPLFVPETKLIGDLLAELQEVKKHLAIVVDEYGDTAGIATLEDIIEEIVGEIADETDVDSPGLVKLDENTAVVDGKMALADLNDEMDLAINTDDADTVAGLVFLSLGHVPIEGETLDLEQVRIEVLRVDNTRIRRLRLIRQET
jgi:CBS domain containing-hemolysin-like protein